MQQTPAQQAPGMQHAGQQLGPHPIQQFQQGGTPPPQHPLLPPPGPLLPQQPPAQQHAPVTAEQMLHLMQQQLAQQGEITAQNSQMLGVLTQLLQSQMTKSEQHSILPAQAAKHDAYPQFSGYTKADQEDEEAKRAGKKAASYRERNQRVMGSLMEFRQQMERWMARHDIDPAYARNHERCLAMLDLMLTDEANTWLTQTKAMNPGLTYNQCVQMLMDHYVPEEEVKALRHAVQTFRWTGKTTMREHCDTFMQKLQRLVAFTHCSAAQAWTYFKDSVESCQTARQMLEIKGWYREDAQPPLQDVVSTLCKVVDEPRTSYGASTSSGGITPMDIGAISALTNELQELKLQLSALGAEAGRGRGYDRDNRGSGYGKSYGQQRGRSPERGRSGGWGGGRDQSPSGRRGASAPPRIENLRRHHKWPRWAVNMTQADIDKAVAERKCFLCGGEQHRFGWYDCGQRDRSRTPTPVRQGRGDNPNGYRAPSPGR
jgi:hypothetical protein